MEKVIEDFILKDTPVTWDLLEALSRSAEE